MITISLCMIVKNESKVLRRCLDSIKDIVDEIVIVDTGSNDDTKSIAKEYTENVFDFKWINDFSKARNYSFSKATKEYILWLDADDIILEKDRKKLVKLKESLNSSVDLVMMKYNVGFDEDGNVTLSYFRERLLKREKNYKWISPIHEVIVPNGNLYYSNVCITHSKENQTILSKRNLEIFESMIKENIPLDARQCFYYARELMYHKYYVRAIDMFNRFLIMNDAWIENKISGCIDLANCYNQIGKNSYYLPSLMRTFEFDIPRAEICSMIGIYFQEKQQYNIAIYWFLEASKKVPITKNGGFCSIDYYKFIPYINLCVCYEKLGKIELAKLYNDKAGKIKPTNKSYLFNKDYFDKKN